jgi:hypothetical protein
MNEKLMLVGLSNNRTGDDIIKEAISRFSVSELQDLAFDIDPLSRPSRVDELKEKIAVAATQGRELAHENSSLDKIAFLPALASGAGKVMGALGGAKGLLGGIAKDIAIGGAANKVIGALKPAAPAASAAGEVAGGFKYASFPTGALQRAAGYVVRNPGTALTAAGALGGAMMAPRDPQTGQKQYLRGALTGGVGAAGINALSNGAVANKMRSAVMNRNNPILGQKTRQYMMDAAAATKGKVPGANGSYVRSAPAAAQAAPAAAQSPAPYMGGPTVGAVKLSNQRLLTYDPATKTFARTSSAAAPSGPMAFAPAPKAR